MRTADDKHDWKESDTEDDDSFYSEKIWNHYIILYGSCHSINQQQQQ